MIGGLQAPRWARWLDGWYLPVNLFDTMYVAFRNERRARPEEAAEHAELADKTMSQRSLRPSR
jgi:hypothetical protein